MKTFRALRAATFALFGCGVLALAAALPATAISPSDKAEIEAIIKNYLLNNPEVLREALIEMQRWETAEATKARSAAVEKHKALIYDSPRGVTLGNKNGDVTIVEFFDYNCGYCKRALDDMTALMKSDPKLKFVLKEFPVLGPGSLEAAKVGIAVRMQDKDGSKYLDFHRRLLSNRGQVDGARARAAAKEAGADMALLERDLKTEEIDATLYESEEIATALGVSGTPSYVIGGEVVPGAVGTAALKKRVDAVRQCGKASC
jgi:protein-disulfide isomerase